VIGTAERLFSLCVSVSSIGMQRSALGRATLGGCKLAEDSPCLQEYEVIGTGKPQSSQY